MNTSTLITSYNFVSTAYHDLQSIVKPLKNREQGLKGVLVDTYVAGEMTDFSSEELRVNKIIDHNSYYGIVFGPGGRLAGKDFQTCFEDYFLSNQAAIFETVKQHTQPMKVSDLYVMYYLKVLNTSNEDGPNLALIHIFDGRVQSKLSRYKMAHSFCETRLQGIMAVVFITLHLDVYLINATTMILYKRGNEPLDKSGFSFLWVCFESSLCTSFKIFQASRVILLCSRFHYSLTANITMYYWMLM